MAMSLHWNFVTGEIFQRFGHHKQNSIHRQIYGEQKLEAWCCLFILCGFETADIFSTISCAYARPVW